MEIEYYSAIKDDIHDLVRMRLDYLFTDYPDMDNAVAEQIASALYPYFEEHLNEDLFAFIARDMRIKGEAVASTFLLVIEKPANPTLLHGRIGEVLNVYTNELYRNQGICTSLMKLLLEKGKETELDYIRLSATKAGREVYSKVGFEDYNGKYQEMRFNF